MKKENIVENNKYWVIGPYIIEPAMVTEKLDTHCRVKYLESPGSSCIMYDNIFVSKEAAIVEAQRRSKEREDNIAAGIQNPEDLFNMMIQSMYAEEYTDWEKIAVAKKKIKEYFGIDIKEN